MTAGAVRARPRRRPAAGRAPRRSANGRCCPCTESRTRATAAPRWPARARARSEPSPGGARRRRRQQLTASSEVDAVVGVAAVGRAPPHRDQAPSAAGQVVGDQALRLAGQLVELAHLPVAAGEFRSSRQRIGCPARRRKRGGEVSPCRAGPSTLRMIHQCSLMRLAPVPVVSGADAVDHDHLAPGERAAPSGLPGRWPPCGQIRALTRSGGGGLGADPSVTGKSGMGRAPSASTRETPAPR